MTWKCMERLSKQDIKEKKKQQKTTKNSDYIKNIYIPSSKIYKI